ncbi:hypothetical protein, partial [Pseudomonas aeruginosa]
YSHYECLEAVPQNIRGVLERRYVKRTLEQVWQECEH